jgi:HAD superfamily hydrolase (TIGR01549 family)
VYREYIKVISSKAFLRHIKIMPKAKQTLKTLGKKYRLVLATGALHISLVPALRKFRLKKYFNFIVTGDDVKIAKPNPEIILKPIKKLGLKRNEVIYIGDAPNDVTSAKRAGVKIVTVLTGVLSRKEAKRLKADFVVSDISKIGKILKGLNR